MASTKPTPPASAHSGCTPPAAPAPANGPAAAATCGMPPYGATGMGGGMPAGDGGNAPLAPGTSISVGAVAPAGCGGTPSPLRLGVMGDGWGAARSAWPRAEMNEPQEGKRPAGSRDNATSSTCSIGPASAGLRLLGGGKGSRTCIQATASGSAPENGTEPVNI